MRPDDLIQTANDPIAVTARRPRQTNLRRAVSTAYYAMFHCLARDCANLLIGGTGAERSSGAWLQVYRALDHGAVRKAVSNKEKIGLFPVEVAGFASTFVTLQAKRNDADYNPREIFTKSDVKRQIESALSAIRAFETVPKKDRRAFAALVILKDR